MYVVLLPTLYLGTFSGLLRNQVEKAAYDLVDTVTEYHRFPNETTCFG